MESEVLVKWTVKLSETSRILELLPTLVEATRNEEGNLMYHIYQSADKPNVLILHERYIDSEAMDIHKNSDHYKKIVLDQIVPYLENREVSVLNKLF